MRKKKIKRSGGFTLIELLLATAIGSIVVASAGALMVGFWRSSLQFIYEEQTMQEISTLSRLFSKHSHSLPSSVNAGFFRTGIVFPGETTATLLYHPFKKEIVFDPDTDVSGGESDLLSQSIVDDVFAIINTGGVVRLDVKIREDELDRVNTYQMYAAPRNE